MESHSDTTKYQAGVVASRLADTITELQRSLNDLTELKKTPVGEKIVLGSIVELRNEHNNEKLFLLLSGSGGIKFNLAEKTARLITLASPIGQSLANKKVGQTLQGKDGKTLTIVNIY